MGEQDPGRAEVVELTIDELDVLVGAVDCCMRLGGQIAPHASDLWKSARGKLLFAHRKAWLRKQGLEETLSESELANLRASLMGGQPDLSDADARAYEQQIIELLQEQAARWAEQPPGLQPGELESVELRGTRPDTEIVFRFSRLGNFEGLERNAARSKTRAVVCRLWQTGYPESEMAYTGELTSAEQVVGAIWGDWIADELPPWEGGTPLTAGSG